LGLYFCSISELSELSTLGGVKNPGVLRIEVGDCRTGNGAGFT